MPTRKPWRDDRSTLYRRENTREQRRRFLIVCEGLKTEPNYFRGFRVPKAVLVIDPAVRQHVYVVQRAIELTTSSVEEYDEVWCVFDRDKNTENPNDARSFNDALQLARAHGINVAYSNDAFELWYVLHFEYLNTAIARRDYLRKLDGHISGYRKGDPGIFKKLEDKMEMAIRHANMLLAEYSPSNPVHDDPSTTVHLLVLELRKYI